MRKIKDLAVKTGEYQSGGSTKGRWKTVGALMEDDKGGQFMFLDRAFNPAGVPAKDGSESILISLFDPKKQGETTQASAPPPATEDIPF